MPHIRNRMKLRGDIHPPEVEYDLSTDLDDDPAVPAEAARLDDIDLRLDQPAEPTIVVLAVPDRMGAREKAQQIAGRQLANRPMVAMLGAFAFGILLARMLKKGAHAL
jgi:hypothetical protein